MLESWIPALIFIVLSFSVGFVMVLGNWVLRVRAKDNPETKYYSYECGEEPEGNAWLRFHPRYYVVALVFILFDVETVFIIPWALNIEKLGTWAIIEMFVFVGVLLLGWLYALRKGAFKWQ